MAIEVGSIVEGKVTGIANFGAFVELGVGMVGLVHISQVANAYVTDIKQFLKVGDTVKVKVLGKTQEGKYDLSIKQAAKPEGPPRVAAVRQDRRRSRTKSMHPPGSFEDKITRFLKQSEEKLLDVKRNVQGRQEKRKRKSI